MERDLRNNFEEKYVGFYRWLLFLIGIISTSAFLIFCGVFVWSISSSSEESINRYFTPPGWDEVRKKVLPVTLLEKRQNPVLDEDGKRELILTFDPRILEIRSNLLEQFSDQEIEIVKLNFSKRFLSQWLIDEILLPPALKNKFLSDISDASILIGKDGRVNRIGDPNSRSKVVIESFEAYVSSYLASLDEASDRVVSSKSDVEAAKMEALTMVAFAIPVSVAIFLSMIVLILIIRIEMHARNIANDFKGTKSEEEK